MRDVIHLQFVPQLVYLAKDGLGVKRSALLAGDPSLVHSTHMTVHDY